LANLNDPDFLEIQNRSLACCLTVHERRSASRQIEPEPGRIEIRIQPDGVSLTHANK